MEVDKEEYGVYPGDFNDEYQFDVPELDFERVVPEKHEHEWEDDDYESEYKGHIIPEKSEHFETDVHHLPKEKWTPDFHSREIAEEMEQYEDGIDDKFIDGEQEGGKLKLKEFEKDDPRLHIPKGKASPLHDHLIVPKEPEASPDHTPKYGKAYEHERKEAVRGSRDSAGLSPKLPTSERKTQFTQ